MALDYEVLEHFGLGRDPFRIPDADASLFETRDMRRVGNLVKGLVRDRGISAVVGQWGQGKSVSVEHALKPHKHTIVARPVITDFQNISPRAIFESLLDAMGYQNLEGLELPSRKMPRSQTALNDFMRQVLGYHAERKTSVVLVLEEAHDLRYHIMRGLKTLVEMKWRRWRPLLSVLLVGHQQLERNLRLWPEVGKRTTTLHLRGLSKKECHNYLGFLLSNDGARKVFEEGAIDALHSLSGAPLIINAYAAEGMDRAMRAGRKLVTPGDVMGGNGEAAAINLDVLWEEARRLGIEQVDVSKSLSAAGKKGFSRSTVSLLIGGQYRSDQEGKKRRDVTITLNKLIEARRQGRAA